MPTEPSSRPIVELFSLYPSAPLPERASSSLRGSLPIRAVQYCQPITSASAFGFYLYPAVDIALRWDGEASEMALLRDNEPVAWRAMSGNVAPEIPDRDEVLAGLDPGRREELLGSGETELTLINFDPRDPNTFEMHNGVVARTAPGWSLLVRAVPNLRPVAGLRVLDGVLETSWWRGFVPVTGRLTEPKRIVRVHRNYPIACVQPIPDAAFDPDLYRDASIVAGIDQVPDDVWSEMVANFERRNHSAVGGTYKREVRRRQASRVTSTTTPSSDALGPE